MGIPFAATTGGQNRWKPPQSAPAWTTTLETTAFGKVCPQISPVTRAYDAASDENCLTINVRSKDLAPAAPMPVELSVQFRRAHRSVGAPRAKRQGIWDAIPIRR
jgi:carboxylesterase 2